MDKIFEEYRFEMLETIMKKYPLTGSIQSEIDSLDFYISDSLTELYSIVYEPSLCIILQGSKAVGFGSKMYGYNHKEYLLSSTHVLANVKVLEASKEQPYISLRIKFNLEDIYEVLKNTNPEKLKFTKQAEKGLFFDNLDLCLYEPVTRLIKLLERPPEDINYLSSFIVKEILYNLVNGNSGYFINKFAMQGTISNKIVKAITQIKENFNEKLNIKELASSIQMSESSLYQHFKTVTSLSPIQFQKKLRLEEAKQFLLTKKTDIAEIAFLVGYESPSQFSREFSRMYGISPKSYMTSNKKNTLI
jgi:AraC-like DNA-binding protein